VKVFCTAHCFVDEPISIGERALFLLNGMDLWATDGTADGTRFLRSFDTALGFQPSVIPSQGFAWVWDSQGLWRTDGTAAGTLLLKRLDELATPSLFPPTLGQDEHWHDLFFGVLGSEDVLRSDGTPEGTFRIASFPDSSGVSGLAPLDSELLFLVSHFDGSSSSIVLWSTRGTAETTGPKLALETASTPSSLTSLGSLGGGRAVFLAGEDDEDPTVSTQVWVTDGTAAGTRPLAVPPGIVPDSRAEFFTTGDGRALFFRDSPFTNLWITDGTEAGTHAVQGSWETAFSSGPLEQAALAGKLVFSADPSDGPTSLFVSDGTAAGTERLSEKALYAFSFFPFGGRLLFSTSTSLLPRYLWATDGTPDGTTVISRQTGLSNPALLGGQILFAGGSGSDTELWKADSLARSFNLVKDIDPFVVEIIHHQCEFESSFPVFGGVVNGRQLFAANDGRTGRELWASDGTAAGTVQVRDINPGRAPGTSPLCPDPPLGPHRHDTGLSSDPQDFVLLGSVALFTADDGNRGRELWISNGTFPGTRRVADLLPGPRGSAPHDLVRFHNRVYFLAANPGQGESLWQTDGTARGTTRVRDLAMNGQPSWGRGLTVAAGRLFFTVYNETTGAELWASTGNAADTEGTGMVADLNPGPGSSSAQFLTAVGGALLFTADDGLTGLEPWRTDGTAAGTVRLGDIAPGRDASSPGPYTALQNIVMTGADDGTHGREPWAIPRTEIEISSRRPAEERHLAQLRPHPAPFQLSVQDENVLLRLVEGEGCPGWPERHHFLFHVQVELVGLP